MMCLKFFLGVFFFFSLVFFSSAKGETKEGVSDSLSDTPYFDLSTQSLPEAEPGIREGLEKEMVLHVKVKKHLLQKLTSVSQTEIKQEEIRKLPQGSEISLSKLLTSTTPGVVLGPFGQMFFRGNHGNVQYQIDGVQLPETFSNRLGQAFSPRNIKDIKIITGGFPAEYGWNLSSVVSIKTQEGREKPEGEIELNWGSYDTTSPHMTYGGSNELGNLKYFFSLNYFSTNRGLDTPNPQSTSPFGQKEGGKESVHNHAYGDSEFAKIDWQADNENKFSFLTFHSYSRFEIPNYPSNFSPDDPYFSAGYTDVFGNQGEVHDDHAHTTFNYTPSTTNDFQRETNVFAQAVWKHIFSPRSWFQIAPYYKYSQIIVNNDPSNDLYTATGGPYYISGATPSSFAMNRHVNDFGLKSDFSLRASDTHGLKIGFQAQSSKASGGFSVTGVNDAGVLKSSADASPATGYFEGIYIQDTYSFSSSLIFNVGLRFDATQFVFSDSRAQDSLLQPRLGLNYLLTDTTKLHFFYGKLFQPAGIDNLRYAFSLINGTGAPYDIKAEKDDYYEAGIAQEFFKKHVVQLNVYYKNAINMLDEAQLLNTSLTQPFNYAQGYAYGIEFSLKGKLSEDWSEFTTYSYSIAKGKGISGGSWAVDPDENNPFYQYLDHLQIHTANAGLTYAKSYFWWTTQGLFGSGLRTGRDKSISLPVRFTMDTTIGYEFHGDHWFSKFRLSGDMLNIFDTRFPITIANGFNGSHYAAGRQFFIRLAKNF